MISGYVPAVVTPFRDGYVDFAAFERYIECLLCGGVSGIVVCGSTGESLSLSTSEKSDLMRVAYGICRGRADIVAGVISPITMDCLDFMKKVENISDGFLCICPFYICPSQEQIYEHFKVLSASTEKYVILYNNPSRVGTRISMDTYKKLAEIGNIVAIKECIADTTVFASIRKTVGSGLALFSGNDDGACAAFDLGASGAISVTANVVPRQCVAMFDAFVRGDLKKFNELSKALSGLHPLLFDEPSPSPVKYILSRKGLMQNELRKPLSPITEGLQRRIDTFLESLPILELNGQS
jgi:4-hydroxy-tetrahydrodipicolinate synthase